jgi:hypothetical protein
MSLIDRDTLTEKYGMRQLPAPYFFNRCVLNDNHFSIFALKRVYQKGTRFDIYLIAVVLNVVG